MHKPAHQQPDTGTALDELRRSRYALLRTYRRDGTPVDTPIWFRLDGKTVLFRTKIGPKTKRLAVRPDVELTACDYKGRFRNKAAAIIRARIRAPRLNVDKHHWGHTPEYLFLYGIA